MRLLFVAAFLLLAGSLRAQCPDGSPPPCNRSRARPAAPALSVAILDFQNLSHDTSDAYLADGVAEEVAERLGRVQRLTVVSRTAVQRLQNAATMPTADLGRALNVSFLVTGSVRRAGGRVRVGVELLRAATGVQGWADQYDRDQGDLLAMQDEIASSVATEITGHLLPAESQALRPRAAPNPAAYDAYLKGKSILQAISISQADALPWFQRAVAIDSTFADAWAMIGLSDALLHDLPDPATDTLIVQGRAAATRAIELAPDGNLGHVALGFVLYRGGYDYAGAEREFRLAIARDPNSRDAYSGLATIYKRQGRFEESVAARMRAIALDPLDPAQPNEMTILMSFRHHWAESEAWLDRLEVLLPGDSGSVRFQRMQILLMQGRIDDAVALASSHPAPNPLQNGLLLAVRMRDTAAIRAGAYGPRGGNSVEHFVGWAEVARLTGMTELWQATVDSLRAAFVRAPVIDSTAPHSAETLIELAYVRVALGDTAEALRVIGRVEREVPAINDVFRRSDDEADVIELLMRLGRKSDVLERLPRVLSGIGMITAAELRIDPVYAPLRGDPRFEAILAAHPN